MIRFSCVASLVAMAMAAPGHAAFSCPAGTTPLEKKDDSQWMKACLDSKSRLHGPFEIWTRATSSRSAEPHYRKTIQGWYGNGMRSGKWIYWDIEGVKVAEKVFED